MSLAEIIQISKSQLQAAYIASTQGLKHCWSFFCNVMQGTVVALAPLQDAIYSVFLSTLCGQDTGKDEQQLFALPCRKGGPSIINPTTLRSQFQASIQITALLVTQITAQSSSSGDAIDLMHDFKCEVIFLC